MSAVRPICAALAFIAAMAGGVYLAVHDHPVLGGWVCILSLCGDWGFERIKKSEEL